jgi:hypothetical protein
MREIINREHKYQLWDRNFLETTSVIAKINTPYGVIQNILSEIENKSRSLNTTVDELIALCYELVGRLPLPLIELDVPHVIRCRPDYQADGKVYSCIGDLSYNPKVDTIRQGRFNVERVPVFYASVPSQTKHSDVALTAILESNKELLDKNASLNDRFATVSKWNIKKPFMVVNFSFHEETTLKNLSVRQMNYFFIKQMLRSFTEESLKSFLMFCRFMSEKAASKKENISDYLITNAYKKALEKYYGQAIKGILYPSSMTENSGLNVAICKKVIDDGEIQFDGALVYKIKSHPFELSKELFPCTSYVTPNTNGNFQFKFD